MTELVGRQHVTVKDLAENMAVSEATVRRDLRVLAESQQLRLIHGGATLPSRAYFSFQAKQERNLEAKQIVGRMAAGLVADGDQIFLDSGTTSFAMASELAGRLELAVIVNSARLALELKSPGMNVIMLGGQYRPDRMDTIGPVAMSTLDQLRGYVAFVGADGVAMDFGVSAADIESAHLYRLAVSNARETNLLVDHSKFESASLFKIVGWEKIRRVVTDRLPSEQWMSFLGERGIEVIHPGSSPTNSAQ
jgi:DeoR family transcriptional regulator, fructose operon transcriptional repressor